METGYYKQVKKTRHVDAVIAVEEQGHWKVIKEYPETGGKDVEWVVDVPGVPGVPEHDEEYWDKEWVEYTPKEMAQQEIDELKKSLADTDYIVLKLAEAIADENTSLINSIKSTYSQELSNRIAWRARINELESQLNGTQI